MANGGWGDFSGHAHPQAAASLGVLVLVSLGVLVVIKHLFGEVRAGAHVEV